MDFPRLEEGKPGATVTVELSHEQLLDERLINDVVLIRRDETPETCLQAGVRNSATFQVPIGAEATVENWQIGHDHLLVDLRAGDEVFVKYDHGGIGWRVYSKAFAYSSIDVETTRRTTWTYGPLNPSVPRPTVRFEGPIDWRKLIIFSRSRPHESLPRNLTRRESELAKDRRSPAIVLENVGPDDFPYLIYGELAYAKLLQRIRTEWTIRLDPKQGFVASVRPSKGLRVKDLER